MDVVGPQLNAAGLLESRSDHLLPFFGATGTIRVYSFQEQVDDLPETNEYQSLDLSK